MMKKIKNINAMFLAFLMVFTLGIATGVSPAMAMVDGYPLTPEEVSASSQVSDPTGRISFTLSPSADGTGHGTDGHCVVREEMGFPFGDETPQDGIVCSNDRITYKLSYNVGSSETPTTVTFRVLPEVQNEAGQPLNVNANASVANSELLTICQGGTGFVHTGVMSGNTCTMTFPATNATSTSDLGSFDAVTPSVITDGYVDMRMLVSGNRSDSLPNRTRIVGVSAADTVLVKSDPKLETVDGESYYTFTHYLRSVGPNATKGIMRYENGSYIGSGSVQLDNVPEGTQIELSHENMRLEGNSVIFEDLPLRPSQVPVNMNNIGTGVNTVPYIHSIVYKIPLDALEEDVNYDITGHITSVELIKEQHISNADDFLYPDAWFNKGSYTPGLGHPSTYNTGGNNPDPLYSNSYQGRNGHANNDWATVTVKRESTGVWFKDLYRNNNGEVDETYSVEGTSGVVNTLKFYDDTFWAKVGMNPFAGSINDAIYCDVWDADFQRVDTRYEPYAEVWNKDTEAYERKDINIEYGVSTRNPLPVRGGGAEYAANQIEDCGDAGQATWSDTPTEETNMFRVSFEGEQPAYSAPPLSEGRRGSVQAAYIPFTSGPVENFSENPYPTAVFDTLMFSHNGAYQTKRDTATTFFQGTRAEAEAPSFSGTHNSGTKQSLVTNNNPNIIRANIQETINWTPEYTIEIGSHFSNIEFNPVGGTYELIELIPADFGPDGLPGTDDDVSGWKLVFKETKERVLENNAGADGLTRWISAGSSPIIATLPGHIPNGTQIPVKSSVNADELPGDKADNNLHETFITAVARDSVSQEKWNTTPLEATGKDVTWGLSWSNSSNVPHGDVVLQDVLPYEGDANGTKLASPISDVRVNFKQADSDVRVEATSVDPTTIQDSGSVEWITIDRETGQPVSPLDGEITALRIIDPQIEADKIQLIEVTVSTAGSEEKNILSNNLRSGTVDSMTLPLPATSPVDTVLYSTLISGTVFYDGNQNSNLDSDEDGRIKGSTIELRDPEGNVVSTTTSDDDGNYSFVGVDAGDYTIHIVNPGDNVGEEWVSTTPNEIPVKISPSQPKNENNNFGYWGEIQEPSLGVEKSIRGYTDGEILTDGSDQTFVFTVTNTGDMPLTDVSLVDDVLGQITCHAEIPTLHPGDSFECEMVGSVKMTKSLDGNRVERTLEVPLATKIGYDSNSVNYYNGNKLCYSDFCPVGQSIWDIEFTEDDNLVAGYGDWNSNVDSFGVERVALTEINPLSGAQMSNTIATGSESIDTIRKLDDGKLYAPTIDPSDKAGYKQTGGNISGAWTDKGSDWDLLKPQVGMIHTFDTAKVDDTYYMNGSIGANGGTAIILEGKDNGEKFTPLVSENHNSFSRSYALVSVGDKLVYDLSSVGDKSGMYSYDTKTGEQKKLTNATVHRNNLTSFRDYAPAYNYSLVNGSYSYNVIDVLTGDILMVVPSSLTDIYVDQQNDELYVLTRDGVYRMVEPGETPEMITSIRSEGNYTSFAIKDNELYLGTRHGTIEVKPLTTNP